jgi:iron complex transport system ATP-binding protein
VRSKFEILHLLYELTRKEQKTIIFTTHDLDMAIRHADKVWLVLAGGLAEGSPEDLMLSGEFDNLFESSSVKFSSSDGTYSIGSEEMRSIHIEGSGQKVHWTKEALKRAGYTVVSQKTTPFIRVNEKGWEYVSAASIRKLESIYELIVYMRNSPPLHL